MYRKTLGITLVLALAGSVPVAAGPHGPGGAKAKPATYAPRPTGGGHKTMSPGKSARPVRTTGAGHASRPVKSGGAVRTTRGPKTSAGGPKAGRKVTSGTTATPAQTSAGSTMSPRLTPVQQKLQRNTRLAEKLQGRLPAGTDLMDAVAGFRNLGQAVAAINVANNQHITFSELKTRMVDDGMSLGQALQDVRAMGDADSQQLARSADVEASTLIRRTEAETAARPSKTTAGSKARR